MIIFEVSRDSCVCRCSHLVSRGGMSACIPSGKTISNPLYYMKLKGSYRFSVSASAGMSTIYLHIKPPVSSDSNGFP
jgi:hypothetical protein